MRVRSLAGWVALALLACTRDDSPAWFVEVDSAPARVEDAADSATGGGTPSTPNGDAGQTVDTDDGESPAASPLSAAEIARPWVKLALPRAWAYLVHGRDGYVTLAVESVTSGKVAVAAHHYLYRSNDGITWHRLAFPQVDSPWLLLSGLAYGARRYVLVGYDGVLRSSADLAQWPPLTYAPESYPARHEPGTPLPLHTRRVFRVAKRFFALGTNGLRTSVDGVTWEAQEIALLQGQTVAYGSGVYVIPGSLSIHRSVDAKTWEDRTPECSTPGAACYIASDGTLVHRGRYTNAVFLDGTFYVDHVKTSDALTWQLHDGPVANDAVGGYLFNWTGEKTELALGESSPLRAWRPGEAVATITVESAPALPLPAGGVGPETMSASLPGGETCLTRRCVIVGGALYLIR